MIVFQRVKMLKSSSSAKNCDEYLLGKYLEVEVEFLIRTLESNFLQSRKKLD